MKPFSNCRALGAPIGQMDLRAGVPSCAGPAADDSIDIGAIHYCFIFLNFYSVLNHMQRSECE